MGDDGVELGYQVPFVSTFSLRFRFLCRFLPLPQGYTLLGELEGRIAYGDVELVPLSPGFYYHLFIYSFSFMVLATMVGLVVSLRVCSSDSF